MRSFILLTLCTLLLATSIARPSQMDERNESELEQTEYEGNEEALAEENAQEEEDSRLSDQDTSDLSGDNEARSQQLGKSDRENYQQSLAADFQRDGRANSDHFSEYSRSKTKEDEAVQSSRDFSSLPKRRQSNRYIDNSDVNDPPENVHLINYKTNRVQGDSRYNELPKKTVDSNTSSFDDNDDTNYENNKEYKNEGDKVEYNNEVVDSNEQARHLKQYYNTMQSDQRSMLGDRTYEMANRDRRQAQQGGVTLSSSSTEKESFSDINNEEDEAAIKRHIRKLSGEELEELLNSLSDDKKALLNKIMDGDSTYESVKKREITKKAGAVDENGLIDNGLSDISKVQGGSSIDFNTEAAISPTTDIESSKQQESQTETSDISNTKTSETTRADNAENKIEFTRQTDANSKIKLESNINTFDQSSDSSNVVTVRYENKRDTNLDYFRNADGSFDDTQMLEDYVNPKDSEDSFNDQAHFCSQDDELTQLMDEEALLHSSNDRQYKREVPDNQADLDDSIKSLEESFPKSNCVENGQYYESNMAPLVRVKRKNEESLTNKRAALDKTDDKVAYFPFKAENEDEDNEEGSEFDDDGFYDRTSNYAKNDANNPADNLRAPNYAKRSPQPKLTKVQSIIEEDSKPDDSANDKMESDTTSLGSDTDNVLSGIEGVDDNLMFSSGTRNRRTAEDAEQIADIDRHIPLGSTPVLSEEAKPSNAYINLPNYQETDAFGPLPRNEGELSRYKRIRRVKPFASSDMSAVGK